MHPSIFIRRVAFLSTVLALSVGLRAAENPYPPGPDSKKQDGVPQGEQIKGVFDQSKIFPGTTRDYTPTTRSHETRSVHGAPGWRRLQRGECL
jgi:hypothetical protein